MSKVLAFKFKFSANISPEHKNVKQSSIIYYQVINHYLVLMSDVWDHFHDKLGRLLST